MRHGLARARDEQIGSGSPCCAQRVFERHARFALSPRGGANGSDEEEWRHGHEQRAHAAPRYATPLNGGLTGDKPRNQRIPTADEEIEKWVAAGWMLEMLYGLPAFGRQRGPCRSVLIMTRSPNNADPMSLPLAADAAENDRASEANATDPEPRPVIPYEPPTGDEGLRSLLGRLAPRRAPPPVDSPTTDGDLAAAYSVAGHPPPPPYPTPAPELPVILKAESPAPWGSRDERTVRVMAAAANRPVRYVRHRVLFAGLAVIAVVMGLVLALLHGGSRKASLRTPELVPQPSATLATISLSQAPAREAELAPPPRPVATPPATPTEGHAVAPARTASRQASPRPPSSPSTPLPAPVSAAPAAALPPPPELDLFK